MKTVPMIFNTEMVKALLNRRKTVLRRPAILSTHSRSQGVETRDIVKVCKSNEDYLFSAVLSEKFDHIGFFNVPCRVGDLIWVRETFCYSMNEDGSTIDSNGNPCLSRDSELFYRASPINGLDAKWIPSIHMPKSASRLTLRVTDVRIERIQDITEEQAKLEGVRYHSLYEEWGGVERHPESIGKQPFYRWYGKATDAFKNLWSSIYSNWNENPYVWVIEFEVIHRNINKVIAEVSV